MKTLFFLILVFIFAAQPLAFGGSLRFLPNEPKQFDFADQRVLPPTFGVGEFTLELWIKPDNSFPVGDTDRGTIGQLTNWTEYDVRPYSRADWWYEGNWLLDGHTRPRGFSPSDSREGTFSLQFYGGGRLRWIFADDAECRSGRQSLGGAGAAGEKHDFPARRQVARSRLCSPLDGRIKSAVGIMD